MRQRGGSAAANTPDNAVRALVADVADEMVVLTDRAYHRTAGDPANQQACKRGTWNVRMVVETMVSLLTTVCRLKQARQRTWKGLHARLAYTMAVFTMLVMWDGIPADAHGTIHLSIAQFVL